MASKPLNIIFQKPIRFEENTNIYEGFHKTTKQKIIIKQHTFCSLSKLMQVLKELFCQAKLRHSHFCDIIDVLFQEKPTGYEVSLCLERLERDLEAEIVERKGSAKPYTEEELWKFLQDTVEAMASAQDLVRLI